MSIMLLVDINTNKLHTARLNVVAWDLDQNSTPNDSTNAQENRIRRLNALKSSKKTQLQTQSQTETTVLPCISPRNNKNKKLSTKKNLPSISSPQIRSNANDDISRTNVVVGSRIQENSNACSKKSSNTI